MSKDIFENYTIKYGKSGEVYAYTKEGEFVQSADTIRELEKDLKECNEEAT